MGGVDPPRSYGDGARIDPRDAELLEALDAANDIHDGVDGPDLVQGYVLRGQPVDPPLGLAEKPKRLHRSITYPVRQIGALHKLKQICYVAMVAGVMRGQVGSLVGTTRV